MERHGDDSCECVPVWLFECFFVIAVVSLKVQKLITACFLVWTLRGEFR